MEQEKEMDKNIKTVGDRIWESLKDYPISIFALDNQVVSNFVTRNAELDAVVPQLHLKLKSAAVLPALEESLGKLSLDRGQKVLVKGEKFQVSQEAQFTIVRIVKA